ncbi:MAG: hypothetical protein M1814_003875 [Vezdaea aestivalis]|nr:MAG: hypothetical protein M1814_003875 [Vezdaea aestivalis]
MASHEDEISMEMQGTVSSLASVNRRDSVFPGHATDNVDHYLATNFIRNDTAITSASLIYSRAENTGNTPFVVYQRPVNIPKKSDAQETRRLLKDIII